MAGRIVLTGSFPLDELAEDPRVGEGAASDGDAVAGLVGGLDAVGGNVRSATELVEEAIAEASFGKFTVQLTGSEE